MLRYLLLIGMAPTAFAQVKTSPSLQNQKKATRIVSCSLASDEILSEILQRAGTLNRLVAVSEVADDKNYSNLAEKAEQLPKGRCGGELESLLKLKPELAIVADYTRPETLRRLEQAKIPSFVIGEFNDLASIESTIRKLGQLVHEPKIGHALADEFRAELSNLSRAQKTPSKKLLQFFNNGTVSGQGTLFDSITRAAGASNAAAEQGLKGWPHVGAETVILLKPDAIVAEGEESQRAEILSSMRNTAGFRELAAVKAGRLIIIPGRELGAVSNHVVKGLRRLRRSLEQMFPESFPDRAAASQSKGQL